MLLNDCQILSEIEKESLVGRPRFELGTFCVSGRRHSRARPPAPFFLFLPEITFKMQLLKSLLLQSFHLALFIKEFTR